MMFRIFRDALTRRYLLALFICLSLPAMGTATSDAPERHAVQAALDAGERIYRHGLLPSGRPLQATVQQDVKLFGEQAACVNCHRRSGFGASEGPKTIPPITGTYLFRSEEAIRQEFYQPAHAVPQRRPAYTEETLRRAIRVGLDPRDRPFDAMMPRYDLSDEELDLLIGYLKSLTASTSPGVTDTDIHFATVVTDGVALEKRRSMLDVMTAFFNDRNAATRNQRKRARQAPWDMEWHYKAYRDWRLHVWELKGSRETWGEQLAAYYRQQPVFALLGGIGIGTWRPMHEFCNRFQVPCVFPNTALPIVADSDFYTIYLSKGLVLEAEALAVQVLSETAPSTGQRILQVFRTDDYGMTPAKALREALARHGHIQVENLALEPTERLTPGFWNILVERHQPSLLILWLTDADLVELHALVDLSAAPSRIYLSSSLLDKHPYPAPSALKNRLRFLHPFALANRLPSRTQAWLSARNIAAGDERVQANTYLALTVAGEALMHIANNFSREYFIERIEHGLEKSLTTSVYPYLSLGPGQRFGSKGCFIARFSDTTNALEPASNWIVP